VQKAKEEVRAAKLEKVQVMDELDAVVSKIEVIKKEHKKEI
jgi:hypothetical protein